MQKWVQTFKIRLSCSATDFLRRREVGAKVMVSQPSAEWLSGGLWSPPSSTGPAYTPTELHFAADFRADKVIHRARRTPTPQHQTSLFSFHILLFCSAQDECGGGGELFFVRSATKHVPHCVHGSLGWPISRPGGQSPEGPGAGPNAAGGEEVQLVAQAGRLSGRIPRWVSSVSHLQRASICARWLMTRLRRPLRTSTKKNTLKPTFFILNLVKVTYMQFFTAFVLH